MTRLLEGWFLVRAVFSAVWLVLFGSIAHSQQLSIRRYDVRDGLVHSRVVAMHQDKKGYLWFGTWEGLSRFDGYQFTNYDTRDGLGDAVINAITDDKLGRLWVATNGTGIARLLDDPADGGDSPGGRGPRRKFENVLVGESSASNRVNAFLFDADDSCWCATDDGLYRAWHDNRGTPRFEQVVSHEPVADFMCAFADNRGRLWFGIEDEVVEVVAGQLVFYRAPDEVAHPAITSIAQGQSGEVLVANSLGVFEFVEPSSDSSRGSWRKLPVTLETDQIVHQVLLDHDGTLWMCTQKGLIKRKDGQTLYTTANGLSDNNVICLIEDREGNLWMGTWAGGACKLQGRMIVSYTRAEGLPDQRISRVLEDQRGQIYAGTSEGGIVRISEGKVSVVPGSEAPPFNNVAARFLQDRRGDWWVGTHHGLFRFHGPELQLRNGKQFGAADGLANEGVEDVYEESTGRVWIGTSDRSLSWINPKRNGPTHFNRVSLGATRPGDSITWIAGDSSGGLWLGARFGLIGRIKNEMFRALEPIGGLPETDPRAMFFDSRGWLWIGLRSRGVSVTKNPSAERPEFVNYSVADGLSSEFVLSICEDDFGRIYLGTFKGLDRLDTSTGEIRHFTTADGLAGNLISHCMKDSRGNIWIATSTGLSVLNPRAEVSIKQPPAVYLSRVQVAGEDLAMAETGNVNLAAPELSSSRNNLLIEFVGLDFQDEQEVKYRYKLEGADAEWSAPTAQRSVNYARLAPGSYRFWVKAINRSGRESPDPAMLEFRILPPVWQRWWFMTLVALFSATAIYSIYRVRISRLIELERVRTRIASDLHDDIGSNLSKIAILSEVAHQQADGADSTIQQPLSTIARISRESVASMSDVVWAINPGKDSLRDLTRRMRAFASDTFTARNIAFEFHAPSAVDLKLGADVRRNIYLIFKETVNNTVRHSKCSKAVIEFRIDGTWLELKVDDNGKGFDPSALNDGNGLLNMKKRAALVGGKLVVASNPASGTQIHLRVPINRGKFASTLKSLRRS